MPANGGIRSARPTARCITMTRVVLKVRPSYPHIAVTAPKGVGSVSTAGNRAGGGSFDHFLSTRQ
jgi:hypothetical protein